MIIAILVLVQHTGVWFEDPVLEACVIRDWDSNGDGVIDLNEADAVTWIQCDGVTYADAIPRHFHNVLEIDISATGYIATPSMWAAPYADLRDGNLEYVGNLMSGGWTFVDMRNNPISRLYQACGPPFCPTPIVWDQCEWLSLLPNVLTDLDCSGCKGVDAWPLEPVTNLLGIKCQ